MLACVWRKTAILQPTEGQKYYVHVIQLKVSDLTHSCSLFQLGASSTLATDVSSVAREDFDASVDATVAHLVSGWVPLMDSSLKDSLVINATANSSYEQVEVGSNMDADTR